MTTRPEFEGFPKIPRLRREVVVTEKIHGTNAQIWISDDGTEIAAGSRNKWIRHDGKASEDNMGFARWVNQNREELLKLGPGKHFAEWYGQGIQHGYGLTEKRLALFNVHRWSDPATRPTCTDVVPILWRGLFQDMDLNGILDDLRTKGSVLVPGWMKPEGVVLFHTAGSHFYKVLLENDEIAKGQVSV